MKSKVKADHYRNMLKNYVKQKIGKPKEPHKSPQIMQKEPK